MIFAWFLLKETKGNTEMENRLLYSPKEVRENRLRLIKARDEKREHVLTLNESLLKPSGIDDKK